MTNNRVFVLFSCALTILLPPSGESLDSGGVTNLSGLGLTTARVQLEGALSKVAAGSGPSYSVVRVNSASEQVVAGTLTKYNADLRDSSNVVKNCNVELWSRQWIPNGNQATIACGGAPTVVRNY